MTLRIPKIPMNLPGGEETIWVEFDEALCRGGLLMLIKDINKKVMNDFLSLFLFLDVKGDDIFVFIINSPGGDIRSGITLYDTMKALNSDVYTSVLGLSGSIASLILSGGTDKERVGFPHARVMIHQPVIRPFSASVERLVSEVGEIFRFRNIMVDIYAQNTGKPISVIQKDLEREKYMSATEAKEYGIIDKLVIYSKRYV